MKVVVTAILVCVLTFAVYAQAPPLAEIEWPVDLASVQNEIGSKGGEMLGYILPLGITFAVAWMIYERLKSAIR